MRPCRVCGSEEKSELNRHHLLPRNIRRKGDRQITIKLCADQHGCEVHRRFHQGDKTAAIEIRQALELDELVWMAECVGVEWVETIYPAR